MSASNIDLRKLVNYEEVEDGAWYRATSGSLWMGERAGPARLNTQSPEISGLAAV